MTYSTGIPYVDGNTRTKGWRKLREKILERSENSEAIPQCECCGECGIDHRKETCDLLGRCDALHRQENPATGNMVALQVSHLDHDTTNNEMQNLRAFCQRCHNNYDLELRQNSRRITKGNNDENLERNLMIKEMKAGGYTLRQIADEFSISTRQVSRITNNEQFNKDREKAHEKGLCIECKTRPCEYGKSCLMCKEKHAVRKRSIRQPLSEIIKLEENR